MGVIHFLKEFVMNPLTTGAIAPSSGLLAKEMIKELDLCGSKAVLEYGPGAGAFTSYVLEAIPASCRFLAIEVNPRFAENFRQRFPGVNVHRGSVEEARRICDEHGIAHADCIVSGLPWAAFPSPTQRQFLDEMMRVLKPGGQFVTFMYVHALALPAGRRFEQTLADYFSKVTRSRIVWANLPPAFVFRCRR